MMLSHFYQEKLCLFDLQQAQALSFDINGASKATKIIRWVIRLHTAPQW